MHSGHATEAEHKVTTSVRLQPYQLPHAYLDLVEKKMLDAGVIDPSSSKWASSIVLVGKNDATLCL